MPEFLFYSVVPGEAVIFPVPCHIDGGGRLTYDGLIWSKLSPSDCLLMIPPEGY